MDFDFSIFVNMGTVAGIIFLVQAVKGALADNKVISPKWVWILIVGLLGIGMGFVVNASKGFNLWDAIQLGAAYGGAATMFYQGGKEGISAAKGATDAGKDPAGD